MIIAITIILLAVTVISAVKWIKKEQQTFKDGGERFLDNYRKHGKQE